MSDAPRPVRAEARDVAAQVQVVAAPAFVLGQPHRAHRVVVQALALGGELPGGAGNIGPESNRWRHR